MKQNFTKIIVETNKQKIIEITNQIQSIIKSSEIRDGLVTLYIKHTSASLMIQENADSDVLRDIEKYFDRLVPMNESDYIHRAEGPDDMPAHIKSLLTSTHLSIPFQDKDLSLGTWQGIFLFEHRISPSSRTIEIHIIGE
tara:strand:+ start:1041 stop:1460 length:420 start_codon:yes stop_codon:yes gene_type:complete